MPTLDSGQVAGFFVNGKYHTGTLIEATWHFDLRALCFRGKLLLSIPLAPKDPPSAFPLKYLRQQGMRFPLSDEGAYLYSQLPDTKLLLGCISPPKQHSAMLRGIITDHQYRAVFYDDPKTPAFCFSLAKQRAGLRLSTQHIQFVAHNAINFDIQKDYQSTQNRLGISAQHYSITSGSFQCLSKGSIHFSADTLNLHPKKHCHLQAKRIHFTSRDTHIHAQNSLEIQGSQHIRFDASSGVLALHLSKLKIKAENTITLRVGTHRLILSSQGIQFSTAALSTSASAIQSLPPPDSIP